VATIGWKLDRDERAELLARFPTRWPDQDADHVTLASDVEEDAPLPRAISGEIVGHVDDRDGLEAMVVRIDGETRRPDGSTYHITWSLDRKRGRKAVESNDVLREQGWKPLPEPVPLTLRPARFG
jgi:hypothetical protein